MQWEPGGRHSSLKRRLKRVHKLFMSVIIWHQPVREPREVQEHLLRVVGGWGPGTVVRARGRSEEAIYPARR